MGKRSRKRGASPDAPVSVSGSSRAERDAARARRAEAAERRRGAAASSTRATPGRRRGRPSIDERPPAPWGKFPLVELVVLLALILFGASFFFSGARSVVMLTAGLALGSLAGLELSIREHFAGYRSHTTILAGAVAFVAIAIVFFAGGKGDVSRALMLPVGGIVFAAGFWFFREAFKRRSGGLGFR
ncbi:MAG: hypothetical protein QOG41_1575 [Thermoleophilaceae bacterium]|jgi:hypothetical protein|nr:hypothetical protein [Thermoleophilaceae bacterium]MEA2388802.1 hypothetical protein [Thermoleophilaceae bacterium]